MIITALSGFLIAMGLFFFVGTTMGLLRFPDFYTRMHAAGKGDTLSTLLVLSGFALYNLHNFTLAALLVSLKLLLIGVFIFIGSPTASHAIMDAGYKKGILPWKKGMPDPDGKTPK